MTGNVELMNYVHQNSEMGQDTIKQLLEITGDENFKKTLQSQFNEYKNIFDLSDARLKELNKDSKEINTFSKVSAYIMINLKTLTDKSPSHISEMLIQGSTMGITDITKKMKEYKDADKTILDLANRLLTFEQQNTEELKKFL